EDELGFPLHGGGIIRIRIAFALWGESLDLDGYVDRAMAGHGGENGERARAVRRQRQGEGGGLGLPALEGESARRLAGDVAGIELHDSLARRLGDRDLDGDLLRRGRYATGAGDREDLADVRTQACLVEGGAGERRAGRWAGRTGAVEEVDVPVEVEVPRHEPGVGGEGDAPAAGGHHGLEEVSDDDAA